MSLDAQNNVSVGVNLIDTISTFSNLPWASSQKILIVTDTQVEALYLQRLIKTLKQVPAIVQIDFKIIPAGDDSKTLEVAQSIFSYLIENHHGRETCLIALGGGMIGDLTGFCAACYLRGVNFIQVPTTLLAQVDAAIGGKVGVNHALGKNLIGAFYQPTKILCDLSLLKDLPEREFAAGLAEVIKYGLALDKAFFEWLENNISLIMQRELKVLHTMVSHCIALKMEITQKDEREQAERVFLNLGHTLGHALEASLDFKTLLHGEAVSIGLVAACLLSQKIYGLDVTILDRLLVLLKKASLPVEINQQLKVETLIEFMKRDKKVKANQLRWVLLKDLAQPELNSRVSKAALKAVLIELGAQP